MRCFFHSDFDGKCAGAIIKKIFPHCEMISIDYRKKFPFDSIQIGEQVFIVDFSIKPEEMLRLLKITDRICWIDHHKTAIEEYQECDNMPEIDGIREVGKSGCILTWEWFYPHETMPEAVKLIGDFDVWKFEYGETTERFIAGLQLCNNTDPGTYIWEELLTYSRTKPISAQVAIDRILSEGYVILQYKAIKSKELLKGYGYVTNFEGHTCFACNAGKVSSKFFGDFIDEYDIVISFIFDGDQYSVSLRSKNVDVSKIAQKYGGGGHKLASGFECKILPFGKAGQVEEK